MIRVGCLQPAFDCVLSRPTPPTEAPGFLVRHLLVLTRMPTRCDPTWEFYAEAQTIKDTHVRSHREFVKAARELGCPEDADAFDRALKKVGTAASVSEEEEGEEAQGAP